MNACFCPDCQVSQPIVPTTVLTWRARAVDGLPWIELVPERGGGAPLFIGVQQAHEQDDEAFEIAIPYLLARINGEPSSVPLGKEKGGTCWQDCAYPDQPHMPFQWNATTKHEPFKPAPSAQTPSSPRPCARCGGTGTVSYRDPNYEKGADVRLTRCPVCTPTSPPASPPCVCGHPESDHRSIPPYHCQHGMAEMKPLCECPFFDEENKERLDAEYEAQKYDDMREQYR